MITVELRAIAKAKGRSATARGFGIGDRTLQLILNEAGRAAKASESFRLEVREEYNRLRPFPLPSDLRIAREELTARKARPGSAELQRFLIMLEGMLNRAQATTFSAGPIKYMLGMCNWSKALHHGGAATWFGGDDNRRASASQAEGNFEEAQGAVKEALAGNLRPGERELLPGEREMLEQLEPAIFINWMCIVSEQAKLGWHRTLPDALQIMREKNALARLKEFVSANCELWQAIYDGLELSSLSQSEDYALWFYDKLKEADKGFQSFDYSPGEVPSLAKEPGMKWFHDRFRPTLHKPLN